MKDQETEVFDYSGKTLAELSDLFHAFAISEDRLQRAQVAEEMKKAFYKTLLKEKEKAQEDAEEAFDNIEENFKTMYSAFKKEKAELNRQLEEQRESNLKAKLQVIEDLKTLLGKDENIGATMPEFREIQARWREIGQVPAPNMTDINKTYQLYVEQFYDKLNINRELRDLDFKKNLEAKTALCEKAEKLGEEENFLEAFRELQKLHDAWKDLGPVAAQFREEIWERFKAASAVINKKYQAHFESLKEEQEKNLASKSALCEQVEAIAEQEISESVLWNTLSAEIEKIQEQWRGIGYATKKENQAVYDRFRAACDKFYARKREFYSEFKNSMEENLKKKEELCEKAEALKNSTEWKTATEAILELQKAWKEIGAVPRKKSDAVWKRFRAACDEFFAEKEKNYKPADNDFRANLKAKQRVISDILAYKLTGNEEDDSKALEEFRERFNSFGFVPFKDKDRVAAAFKEAVQKTFPGLQEAVRQNAAKAGRKAVSEKDRLVAKFRALEQEVATKENNILFFAHSKGNALLDEMQKSIDAAKKELKDLERTIRDLEKEDNEDDKQ